MQVDTAVPPADGQMIAETLSHSFRLEFRGYGHGELYSFAAPTGPPRCAMNVMAQFIDDPTHDPDGGCVAAIPPPKFAGT